MISKKQDEEDMKQQQNLAQLIANAEDELEAQEARNKVAQQEQLRKIEDAQRLEQKRKNLESNIHQTENELNSIMSQHRFSRCPKCKAIVEKNEGCDHIACRCGHNWTYQPGQIGGKYG